MTEIWGDGWTEIPGLPNEISNARAKSLGVEQLLKDAIKAGVYKKLGSKAKEGNK